MEIEPSLQRELTGKRSDSEEVKRLQPRGDTG